MSTKRQALSASYLSHKDNELTFVSRFRPRQQQLSLTLNIGDTDIRVEVQLRQARESRTGDFICHGIIMSGIENLGRPQVPESASRYVRSAQRVAARLRALSPELPNFRALSVDLSSGGIALELEGPITVGERLNFTLDLDLPDQKPVPLKCKVCWCRGDDRSYLAGLQFVDLEPWVTPLLQQFQEWLNGSGLKPKAMKKPVEVPQEPVEEPAEPVPPAGSIFGLFVEHNSAQIVITWASGETFRLTFPEVLVLRDNRGYTGSDFFDALDLEDSQLARQAKQKQPISLDEESPELFHYQFLDLKNEPVFEVLCSGTVEREFLPPDHEYHL